MTERYRVVPRAKPVQASIRPPGSKSITNRACICAALANGTSRLSGVLDSEDTQVMIKALGELGLSVSVTSDVLDIVGGDGQLPVKNAKLFCANSGTSIRFLTAALAAAGGDYQLDGVARMRQRPIVDLTDALERLGADVSAADNGCPPVRIQTHDTGLPGGVANVSAGISSQFLSGLLMAAPGARSAVRLAVDGELVSAPYVDMTLRVMRAFGVEVQSDPQRRWFAIEPQLYQATDYAIEPDASAASYFWAAAAICGGEISVEGLTFDALQGDVGFCRVLEQMGCEVLEDRTTRTITVKSHGQLQGVSVDMNEISDTVQTLAAVALFAHGETVIRGVAHNRHKETDRISDLARELRKFGAQVEELPDGLKIQPPGEVSGAEVETYNDHRMAMSLSLVGLRTRGVEILNPACTAKTYPNFWKDLEKISR